jgi:hypothetical protein
MAQVSTSYTYTLTSEAYTIPLLHAAAHLGHTVLGLLLSSSTSTDILSTTAIPLQHMYTSLSPMTELGLEMVSLYAEEKGLRIVGVYVARDGPDEGLGRIGEQILALIRRDFEGAFALVVR